MPQGVEWAFEIPIRTLRELQRRGAHRERVGELFDRLGWHGIRDRIPAWAPGA